jgi:pyruvate/2-oxoglutarate/acetoin dehydrogenase E1 component
VFIESKHLYFREAGEVDELNGPVGFGARSVRAGSDVTVATAGRMVQHCLAAANLLAGDQISCEVIDMRYIWPLDYETVSGSVAKTSRLAVVHEPVEFCGWGAELAAWVAEHRFQDLDAPIVRIGASRAPIPFQEHLENQVIPTVNAIAGEIRALAAA